MTFVDSSIGLLKKGSYKLTGSRLAVLEILSKEKVPLSAYDIEGRVSKNEAVNIVTIYRILELFEKLGIVHRVHTKEGFLRCDFELQDGCHYFVICSQCGRADEFIEKKCHVEKILPKKLSYKNLKHLSEIQGVCHLCYLNSKN